jgi:hypothetical protein
MWRMFQFWLQIKLRLLIIKSKAKTEYFKDIIREMFLKWNNNQYCKIIWCIFSQFISLNVSRFSQNDFNKHLGKTCYLRSSGRRVKCSKRVCNGLESPSHHHFHDT